MPIPNIDPRYFSLRRMALTGEPVNIDEYQRMKQETPFDFWQDIEDSQKSMVSRNEFMLDQPQYQVELRPTPSGQIDIAWGLSVTCLIRPRSGCSIRIDREEERYARGRMPLQQFFDFKVCEAIERIKRERGRAFNPFDPSVDPRDRLNYSTYTERRADFDPQAITQAIKALEPNKPEPKTPPSTFSLIELD